MMQFLTGEQGAPALCDFPGTNHFLRVENAGTSLVSNGFASLVSFFASLLAIPLACQCCLHATLFTGFQIVGVTLNFLDDVLLLYLPLKPA
jgi:hypothetical protein